MPITVVNSRDKGNKVIGIGVKTVNTKCIDTLLTIAVRIVVGCCVSVSIRVVGTRYLPQSPSIHFQDNNTNITLLRCDITRVTINDFHRLRRNSLRRIRVKEETVETIECLKFRFITAMLKDTS